MKRRRTLLNERIGAEIRRLRRERGWSQLRLAEAIGYGKNQGEVSQWERGKVRPSTEKLAAIAEALDVPVTVFFETNDSSVEADDEMGAPEIRGAAEHGDQREVIALLHAIQAESISSLEKILARESLAAALRADAASYAARAASHAARAAEKEADGARYRSKLVSGSTSPGAGEPRPGDETLVGKKGGKQQHTPPKEDAG